MQKVLPQTEPLVAAEEHGVPRWTWFGEGEPRFTPAPFTRSTLICVRDAGTWYVVHAHFSPGKLGPRPEQCP